MTTPNSEPAAAATGRSAVSRAHAIRQQSAAAGSHALASELRRLRAEQGLSQRRLAARAGVDPSTVARIETARIRARPVTLRALANGIDPDRRAEVAARLTSAAGDYQASDTAGWVRYRTRRSRRLLERGGAPLPAAIAMQVRLFTASEGMAAGATALCEQAAGCLGLVDAGGLVGDLMDLADDLRIESGRLVADGGEPIYGTGLAPRGRGDPLDIDTTPPGRDGLPAMRRWLRQWQVRQGRAEPATKRERDIATAGANERAAVAAAPPVRVRAADEVSQREL